MESLLRWRKKPGRLKQRIKALSIRRTGQQSASIALLVAEGLGQSSDAFPPLKSAICGVLYLHTLAEKVKRNHADCEKLTARAVAVFNGMNEAISDHENIPPDQLALIITFSETISKIIGMMKDLSSETRFSRWINPKDHASLIRELNTQLDNEAQAFLIFSSMKTSHSVSLISQTVSSISYEQKELLYHIQHSHQLVLRGFFL